MSYYGKDLIHGDFPVETFSGNGSQSVFTLTTNVSSTGALEVSVDDVILSPTRYTVDTNIISFVVAPPQGSDNIWVRHLGRQLEIGTPPVDSVSTSKLQDNSVTPAKLQQNPFRKNYVINGDFRVTQRGTSKTFSSGISGYYTADRALGGNNETDGQFTTTIGKFIGYTWFKSVVDIVPTDFTGIKYWNPFEYIFENRDLHNLKRDNKTVTVSFLFQSNVTGQHSFAMRSNSAAESYVTSFNYTNADTIQKISIQIPLTDTQPNILDSNQGYNFLIGYMNEGTYQTSTTEQWQLGNFVSKVGNVNWAANAGNYIKFTEVQLEEGDTATEFEYLPYSETLRLCQRYYCKSYEQNNYAGDINVSGYIVNEEVNVNKTAHYGLISFPEKMRVNPNVTFYAYSGTINKIDDDGAFGVEYSVQTHLGSSYGITAVAVTVAMSQTAGSTRTRWHYTADAEL